MLNHGSMRSAVRSFHPARDPVSEFQMIVEFLIRGGPTRAASDRPRGCSKFRLEEFRRVARPAPAAQQPADEEAHSVSFKFLAGSQADGQGSVAVRRGTKHAGIDIAAAVSG